MANTILTSDILAREALLILENNLVMGNLVDRRYEGEFSSGRQGDAIRIRRPASFSVNEFTNNGSNTVPTQAATEFSTTLTLEKFFDVSFQVTAKEMALSIDDFSANLMQPAMAAMAQQLDSYILSKHVEIGGNAEKAAAGTQISDLADVAKVVQRLNEQKAPMSGRSLVVSPKVMTALFGITEFTQAQQRGDGGSALREASLGRFMGLDIYMDQNVTTHTAGTMRSDSDRAALAIHLDSNGVKKGVNTIKIDDANASASTMVVGDVIRITHSGSGKTHDYAIAATGATVSYSGFDSGATVTISPPLYEDVATNDVVEFVMTATGLEQSIAFNSNAIAMAMVPLDEPLGPGTDSSVVSHNGYSMRASITYNHAKKIDEVSLDVLCGAKVVQPEMAVRLPTSAA